MTGLGGVEIQMQGKITVDGQRETELRDKAHKKEHEEEEENEMRKHKNGGGKMKRDEERSPVFFYSDRSVSECVS